MQDAIISVESEGVRCRKLNEEWEEVIRSVRMLPGFEDFLQIRHLNALKQAGISGPVVILTSTDSTCFALIVTSTEDVQFLRLPELILPRLDFLTDLTRGLSNPAFDLDTFVATAREYRGSQDLSELETRLYAGREGSVNVDHNEVFRGLLADLWRNIVKPVLNVLNLEASKAFSKVK
jgi:hypothetical protein